MSVTCQVLRSVSGLRVLLSFMLILLLQGCIMPGTPWPSRAMAASLSVAGADANAVADEVQAVVEARGFTAQGPGGYEVMTKQVITRAYQRADEIVVSVGLDDPAMAPIRVSSNAPSFTPAAQEVYGAIRTRLESRWPGSVRDIP